MKPKLLLHFCCGVCGINVLRQLNPNFDVTAFFYNPNIQPFEEYKKREEAAQIVCQKEGVPFVSFPYDSYPWFCFLSKEGKGFDWPKEPEGGRRCLLCFALRLEETARFAKSRKFEWFATTLTTGRNKKAEVINRIGEALAKKYSLNFYAADWKKNNGEKIGYQLAKELQIYRQNYCGCLFSKK